MSHLPLRGRLYVASVTLAGAAVMAFCLGRADFLNEPVLLAALIALASITAALDLTLVDQTADNSASFDPAKTYADCTAPVGKRAPEGSIDMGTGYDCTDLKGHTRSPVITPEQRRWRGELIAVMARQGFVNYSKEWWHFSLPGAGGVAYDFPIVAHR